jgi:hypothetical protein
MIHDDKMYISQNEEISKYEKECKNRVDQLVFR